MIKVSDPEIRTGLLEYIDRDVKMPEDERDRQERLIREAQQERRNFIIVRQQDPETLEWILGQNYIDAVTELEPLSDEERTSYEDNIREMQSSADLFRDARDWFSD